MAKRFASWMAVAALLLGGSAVADDAPRFEAPFYTASAPAYLSVDGRTVISFNQMMNFVKVTTAGVDGPTNDIDEHCSTPGLPCVTLLGISLATPPHMGNTVAPDWSAAGMRFHVVSCVREYNRTCFTHLISVTGSDGVEGWFVYSQKRGVELFARKNAGGGYDEVFMLTADAGLLKTQN